VKGRGGVKASRSQVARGREGLTVKIARGGVGHMSGNGPSGRKATPRALLSRTLKERAGVAAAVTKRQVAALARKANPPKVIYGSA
jgi:hypothetical protein